MKATLEMALEALTNPSTIAVSHAVELIKAELAKPKPVPVAWMLPEYGDVISADETDGTGIYNIPLYTAPSRKEWVGLTVEDQADILSRKWWDFEDSFDLEGFLRVTEAKLKERNEN